MLVSNVGTGDVVGGGDDGLSREVEDGVDLVVAEHALEHGAVAHVAVDHRDSALEIEQAQGGDRRAIAAQATTRSPRSTSASDQPRTEQPVGPR